jgi:purine-nucleoside phosphorylase
MSSGPSPFLKAQEAAKSLQKIFGPSPDVAVILGSGLSGFIEDLKNQHLLPFKDVPGGLSSSVQGHSGKFVLGHLGNKRVLALSGRIHGYEGHSPHDVVHLARATRLWGVDKFIITNASGSTHRGMKPGTIALMKDQINFTGKSPLTGPDLFGGERFPDGSDLFSKSWRLRAKRALKSKKVNLKEAVYIGVNGPAYETAAEIKAFKLWGADIVGMSTVWETLALSQMKTQILGLSCICNYGTGILNRPLTHQEVLEVGQRAQSGFRKIVKTVIEATL